MNIVANLARIRSEIASAELQFNRPHGSVKLIAVSKTRLVSAIIAAINAGQMDFGENYCQEAVDKIEAINRPDICWHFIGPVQSNKARQITRHFDWVHTIERIKIAKLLDEMRPADKPPLNICIQVTVIVCD